mgnify:CR=1 FL=1
MRAVEPAYSAHAQAGGPPARPRPADPARASDQRGHLSRPGSQGAPAPPAAGAAGGNPPPRRAGRQPCQRRGGGGAGGHAAKGCGCRRGPSAPRRPDLWTVGRRVRLCRTAPGGGRSALEGRPPPGSRSSTQPGPGPGQHHPVGRCPGTGSARRCPRSPTRGPAGRLGVRGRWSTDRPGPPTWAIQGWTTPVRSRPSTTTSSSSTHAPEEADDQRRGRARIGGVRDGRRARRRSGRSR